MIVTKIEPCTKTKFKIYIDETFKFVLYKGEVSRFGIRIGEEIPPETEEKIRTEVLLKRAKQFLTHWECLRTEASSLLPRKPKFTAE